MSSDTEQPRRSDPLVTTLVVVLILLILLVAGVLLARELREGTASAIVFIEAIEACVEDSSFVNGELQSDHCDAWVADYAATHQELIQDCERRYILVTLIPDKDGFRDCINYGNGGIFESLP